MDAVLSFSLVNVCHWLCVYLFHKDVLSTSFVPGPVLGAGVTMVGTRIPAVTPDNHIGKTGDDDDD